MLTEPGGPFIDISKLNVAKYAQRPSLAKVCGELGGGGGEGTEGEEGEGCGRRDGRKEVGGGGRRGGGHLYIFLHNRLFLSISFITRTT